MVSCSVLAASLEGLDDDFADELDRLKLEIKRKKAELRSKLTRQREVATSRRRSERAISIRESRGWSPRKMWPRRRPSSSAAEAHVQVKEVEIEEAELRMAATRATARADRQDPRSRAAKATGSRRSRDRQPAVGDPQRLIPSAVGRSGRQPPPAPA